MRHVLGYRTVPAALYERDCTVFISTNTFLNGYARKADPYDFRSMRYPHIRGRLKRFAKVSGETVSLTAVEDALAGAFPHYGLHCQIAVITRPEENKGEALIAVTNEPKLTLDEIRDAIKARGLTNLSVPHEIKVVKEIPKLGTGKVNHRELQALVEPPPNPPAPPTPPGK